ncbi:MAG TPA: recombination protein O N-terminal domain-containing protein [Candidatus Paceibacterota bacterium]|nr:recombination protein O N-terminal domain-containing protein [Candidatus Paceibacterota bacterium]
MSHHIYQTDGFILGSSNSGEANRYFNILTRDLGKIDATAQGVRLIESKLRYSLQDYSLSHLSLVRGKDVWRITSASKLNNLYEELGREQFNVFARVFSLLRRLLAGEEKNEELFQILRAATLFAGKERGRFLSNELLSNFEAILVLRILNSLGYLGQNSTFEPFLQTEIWHQELLEQMGIVSKEAISTINLSLRESQL